MKTIQKFLQAFLIALALLSVGGISNAQCTVRSTVKHSCHNLSNGSIGLEVSGTAPFQFLWNNGSQEQNLENLSSGSYTVSVTDAKGSKTTHTVTIKMYSAIQIKPLIEGNKVTAQITGGKTPYTYHWISLKDSKKNVTKQAIQQLSKGNYMLVVEDGNGCSEAQNLKIN